MDWLNLLQALISLIFVIGLLLLTLWAFKYCQQKGINCKLTKKFLGGHKINIIEKQSLDSKNQIVLFECNQTEYLILLSSNNNLILEKKITNGNHDE